MPSNVAIAGMVCAGIVAAGLAIGLGVGLTRDDNDSSPAESTDAGVSQEAGAAGGQAGPAVPGSPLAAPPRGPGDMFPGTAPAAITPLPEPMLAPPKGPAPAPALVAPALVVPEFAPDMAPGPGLEITPELGPDLAPDFAPLEADGPGPLDMPEDAPYEAPEEGPEVGPEDAPVEAPGPAPLDAIEPELEEIDSEIIPTEVEPPAPAPTPVPAPVELPAGTFQDRIVPQPDGKYAVCINGDSDQWGKWDIFRNCGIRVFANGDVELAEWFGGFDGYPAVDPADGHETCFNSAVGDMFGVPKCDFSRTTDGIDDYGDEVEAIECEENADGSQCICTADDKVPSLKSQRAWPGNVGIKKFLETMRERANPTNYDFPQDEEIADAGGRAENVALVQAVFKDMITVSQC